MMRGGKGDDNKKEKNGGKWRGKREGRPLIHIYGGTSLNRRMSCVRNQIDTNYSS